MQKSRDPWWFVGLFLAACAFWFAMVLVHIYIVVTHGH